MVMVRVDSVTCPQAPCGALLSALPLNKGLRGSTGFSAISASPTGNFHGDLGDPLALQMDLHASAQVSAQVTPTQGTFLPHLPLEKSLGQAPSRSLTQPQEPWHLSCHLQRGERHRPHLVPAQSSGCIGSPMLLSTVNPFFNHLGFVCFFQSYRDLGMGKHQLPLNSSESHTEHKHNPSQPASSMSMSRGGKHHLGGSEK